MKLSRTPAALALALAWYVVTHGGVTVAGPFTLLSDCQEVAQVMHAHDVRVSTICRSE